MKYLLYSLFGLVLGLVSVGFLVPLIIDINQYKNYFSDYIKNKSGFNIEILGNLDLKIFPSPKIQISEVNISRSINEEEHQVASIGEMTASFDLPSLVYAKFKIKSMKFDGLDILIDNENTSVFSNSIAKNKKERENFSNELNANNNTKKNNTTKPFFSVEIDKVSFLDSRLKYLRKNINYEILIDELDVSSSYANAYTLDGSIYFQEKKIDVESLLTVDEDIYPLRGKISSDYGVINIQGNLARELKSFDLEIDYYLKSLKNILSPSLESKIVKDISVIIKTDFKGHLSDKTELKFSNMLFRIDENEVTGAFEINHSKKTKFHAAFSSNLLDLNFLTPLVTSIHRKDDTSKELNTSASPEIEKESQGNNAEKINTKPANLNFLSDVEGTLLFTSGVLEINNIPIKDSLIDIKVNEENILINSISGLFPGRTKLDAKLNITKNEDLEGYINFNTGSFRTFLSTLGINVKNIKSDKFHAFDFNGKMHGNLKHSINNNFTSSLDNLSLLGSMNLNLNEKNPEIFLNLNVDNLNLDNYLSDNQNINFEEQGSNKNKDSNLDTMDPKFVTKSYGENFFNFKGLEKFNLVLEANMHNFKLNGSPYKQIDLKAYKTNNTFLIENLNILLADQSLVSVSGKIDQDILSEKHKLDFFANFSILNVSNFIETYGLRKSLSNFSFPVPVKGKVKVSGDQTKLNINLNTNVLEGHLRTEGILFLNDKTPILYEGSLGIENPNLGKALKKFNIHSANLLPFLLTADVRVTENELITDSWLIENGDNRFRGYFLYQKTENKPYVSLQINSEKIDSSFLTSKKIEENLKDVQNLTFEKDQISDNENLYYNKNENKFFKILNSYNGELDLNIKKYIFPQGILNNIEIKTILEDGILEFKNADFSCFGGKVFAKGKLISQPSPSMVFSGKINEVRTKEILKLADLDFLSGLLDADFNLTIENLNDKDLLQQLYGYVNVLNKNGSINGINLDYLSKQNIDISKLEDMLNISKNLFSGSTDLTSLNASAKISNGVAILENTNLILRDGKGSVSGEVELGNNLLNLNLIISSVSDSFPPIAFDVYGNWDKPKASLNEDTVKLLYNYYSKEIGLKNLEIIKKEGADLLFNEVLEGVLDDLPIISDKTNGAKDVKEEKILNERNSDDSGNEKQKDIIIKNIENPEDILEGIIENILKN